MDLVHSTIITFPDRFTSKNWRHYNNITHRIKSAYNVTHRITSGDNVTHRITSGLSVTHQITSGNTRQVSFQRGLVHFFRPTPEASTYLVNPKKKGKGKGRERKGKGKGIVTTEGGGASWERTSPNPGGEPLVEVWLEGRGVGISK